MIIARHTLALLLPFLLAAAVYAAPKVEDAHIPLKFAADDSGADDLICHPGKECYPRLFKATDEFRVIEADQEIPHGLHIRMDMVTGQREAKLNVPTEGDNTNGVVVVPPRDGDDTANTIPENAPRELPLQQQAIKPPKDVAAVQGTFDDAITALVSHSTPDEALAALGELSELAHEAYWGAHLAASPGAVETLLQLLSSRARVEAALVLGSALSNNPKALSHALSAVTQLATPVLTALKGEINEAATKRLLFLLGQTLRDASVRAELVRQHGVDVLMGVFRAGSPAVKGRVAVVVEDTFLNGDMRADGTTIGAKGEEVLAELCIPFAEGVVQLATTGDEEEAANVMSALSALKKLFGCELGALELEIVRLGSVAKNEL